MINYIDIIKLSKLYNYKLEKIINNLMNNYNSPFDKKEGYNVYKA